MSSDHMRIHAAWRVTVAAVFLVSALGGSELETGAVRGAVVDPGGYPLPGASVLVISTDSDRHYESDTGRDGHFRVAGITPGVYRASIRLQGFREKIIDQIQVTADTDADVGTSTLTFLPCNNPGGPICDDFGLSIYDNPIHAQGEATLSPGCWLDVDEGRHTCRISTASGRGPVFDFKVTTGKAGEIYFLPVNGAEFALNPETTYGLQKCVAARFSKYRARIDGLPIGSRICAKSKAGRYSQIMFDGVIGRAAAGVRFRFVTWIGSTDWKEQLIKR